MPDDPRPFEPTDGAPVLPPSRRRLLLLVWAAVTLLLAIRAFADGVLRASRGAASIGAKPWVIDVNRATVGELQALPGIGPTRAEAIVLHRVRHGPFLGLDDLGRVDGIGADTLAAVREYAVAGPCAPERGR
jgi:competence ComEA-like helix-hairpin-helix protein